MDAQTVTMICSVIIALVALFVAALEARATRTHNRLSVKPHLGFDRLVNENPPKAKVILTNNGVGPAFIRDFAVEVNGERITPLDPRKWPEIVTKIGIQGQYVIGMKLDRDSAIGVGDSRELVSIQTSGTQPSKDVLDALYHLNILIKYNDVYGTSFKVELNSDLINNSSKPFEQTC